MPFNIALAGLQTAQSELSVTGNNIANASTPGFKRARAEFADVYATSALGTTATAIGTGVRLVAVSQQFTQGTVNFSDNNLDLALNGQGFFIVSDNGTTSYSRAGIFGVDREGYVTNSSGHRLQGLVADNLGNITGEMGDLILNSANLSPEGTTEINSTLNLNASTEEPISEWVGTANYGDQPPSPNTYNDATSATIYDSLGNSHILTIYFDKSSVANTWDVRLQVDGVDVYTNSAKPNSVTSAEGNLLVSDSLPVLASDDASINGTMIPTPSSDGLSTVDDQASAMAIATSINTLTSTTGVTATVEPAVVNLGIYTPGIFSGDVLKINNVQIAVGSATESALITAINAAGAGVQASVNAEDQILLEATGTDLQKGRNIQIETDGGSSNATFSAFTLEAVGDKVQRGQVTLSSNFPITIAGDVPGNIGINANTYLAPYKVVFGNNGSFDTVASEEISVDWTPLGSNGLSNGAETPQTIEIDIAKATQFGSPFAVQDLVQDGYTTGRLNEVDVDSSGVLFGRYSNGQSLALGQVVLANFNSVGGLQPLGDTAWRETFTSGAPIISAPGTASLGLIQSGAQEDSNVSLTEELVQLIIAQRNFQANAKTIETADAATQTVINLR